MFATSLAVIVLAAATASAQSGWTLIGWNDLGMHCMDADFSVLAILPPYNTIHAQLIDPSGQRVVDPAGITITYEAVADPEGSRNTTSEGKTDFWQAVGALFGVTLAVDQGLAGFDMPGISNTPQAMIYEPAHEWFTAEGIPLTPYDDSGRKNYYPMMRLTARDTSGNVLATTDIVLPVSDEMTCRLCHASGTGSEAARPTSGWAFNADSEKDYRLNILLLHDEYQSGNPLYADALAANGYDPLGLYATATGANTPVLCANCHGSNALPGTGYPGIEPLTRAIHSRHAGVTDPRNAMTLGASSNRTACYTCHPGSETRCLRGAMGNAVAADGSLAMQCQSCHGAMLAVGDPARQGWFDEPACQECHTGTATDNNGQIRFTSVFDASGQPRVAVNSTFATNPDTPAPGISLFRFSTGHGGLQCEACHGSTHAILPSSHLNDNIQAIDLQGHAGTLAECASCHGTDPQTTSGGPHGMHPVGQSWVGRHGDIADHGGTSACRSCHGADYRGTVLSRSLGDRTISTEFGTKQFWKGFQIGCYTCHNGPSSESRNSNQAPVVTDTSASTDAGVPAPIPLTATDADGNALTLRIVSQPANGTVGLQGTLATYYPPSGFSGTDTFTFAAWDGSTDSNLGHVQVAVGGAPAPCTVSCSASVPSTSTTGESVAFSGSATTSSCAQAAQISWSFGDGSSAVGGSPTHVYDAAGSYTWTMTATSGDATCQRSGTIVVEAAPTCSLTCSAEVVASATAGDSVAFHGSANLGDGCSTGASITWSFGDGSGAASGGEVSHVYTAAGSYTWTMTATSGDATCQRSGTIVVGAAPTCSLTCSAEVVSSASPRKRVEFHGAAETHDCSGTPTYRWDFGDGTSTRTGQEVTHRYSGEGSYDWTLTVTVDGQTCTTTGTIAIARSLRRFLRSH